MREPAAAGGWLVAVLVNVCRAELRRPAHETLVGDPLSRAARSTCPFRMADRVERRGHPLLATLLGRDFADGVTARPQRVIPGEGGTVVELLLRQPSRPATPLPAR